VRVSRLFGGGASTSRSRRTTSFFPRGLTRAVSFSHPRSVLYISFRFSLSLYISLFSLSLSPLALVRRDAPNHTNGRNATARCAWPNPTWQLTRVIHARACAGTNFLVDFVAFLGRRFTRDRSPLRCASRLSTVIERTAVSSGEGKCGPVRTTRRDLRPGAFLFHSNLPVYSQSVSCFFARFFFFLQLLPT